jgi:hypothetical protein
MAATGVLVATFLALAAVLAYAALVQVARGRASPPIVAGATAAASAVTAATVLVDAAAPLDIAVAFLLLGSAVLLWLAPSMDERYILGQRLDGSDLAAAAVTVAVIAALARAATLALPGGELFIVAVLVFAVGLAARSMPAQWRRGPVLGAALVGAVVAVLAAWGALGAAIGVIRAASPLWDAPLGEAWQRTAEEYVTWGWRAPVALAVLAVAASIALPKPQGDDVAAVLVGLAAVGAPVAFGLSWEAPLVLGLLTTLGLASAAVIAWEPRTGYTRVSVAAAVGLYTVSASLIAPSATAGTLLGLVTIGVIVAIEGWLVDRSRRLTDAEGRGLAVPGQGPGVEGRAHIPVVGGAAVAGAILAASGAAASLSATMTHRYDVPVSAALAAAALGMALAGLLCRDVPMYLPYVTAGAAGAATVSALASLTTDLPAAVYAAAAALIGVLAELLRVRTDRPEAEWAPAGGWRPDRTRVPLRNWRAVRRPGGFGSGVIAASGIPAAIAVALLAKPLAAALIGPYRWVTAIWTGTEETAASLGWFDRWAGEPTDVAAAATLTFAAALAAVGLGGSRQMIIDRAVAAIIPGVAITLLIAPAALDQGWPIGNLAALTVAVMSGLGLALTAPPPDTEEGPPLRVARRVIFVIGLAAAGAGLAGSFATRSTTLTTLAGTVFFGLIGALRGRTVFARLFAWQLVAGSLLGFAAAAGLAAGLPARQTAVGVLVAATALIGLAAVLPRLRRGDREGRERSLASEQLLIESIGYVGLVVALLMTWGAPEYTAPMLMAAGTVLGVAAIRPGRPDSVRSGLVIIATALEVVAIWMLLRVASVAVPEAYTLPFAALALVIGLVELRRRPELGSWLAYGPALVAAFAPTLAMVLVTDSGVTRRVLLIVAAVLTVAVGAVRRHKAPVTIGAVVTAVAALHELSLVGRLVPWWVLLLLFTATGALLVGLGATYERRRAMQRLRGAYGKFR